MKGGAAGQWWKSDAVDGAGLETGVAVREGDGDSDIEPEGCVCEWVCAAWVDCGFAPLVRAGAATRCVLRLAHVVQ